MMSRLTPAILIAIIACSAPPEAELVAAALEEIDGFDVISVERELDEFRGKSFEVKVRLRERVVLTFSGIGLDEVDRERDHLGILSVNEYSPVCKGADGTRFHGIDLISDSRFRDLRISRLSDVPMHSAAIVSRVAAQPRAPAEAVTVGFGSGDLRKCWVETR
jgi:hypothetical protein